MTQEMYSAYKAGIEEDLQIVEQGIAHLLEHWETLKNAERARDAALDSARMAKGIISNGLEQDIIPPDHALLIMYAKEKFERTWAILSIELRLNAILNSLNS